MNYEGLLTGKKATVIIASGSDFGPWNEIRIRECG